MPMSFSPLDNFQLCSRRDELLFFDPREAEDKERDGAALACDRLRFPVDVTLTACTGYCLTECVRLLPIFLVSLLLITIPWLPA